jgi:N-glycosylase/DNA lyase
MKIEFKNKEILLKEVKDFNAKHIFECGQCFRWKKKRENYYVGVANKKVIGVEQLKEDQILIRNATEEDFKNIWYDYFDFKTDYGEIKKILSKNDATIKEAISFGEGIRILNQDPFETLISFVISANNRIPMIMRAAEGLSQKYGEFIESFEGEDFYSFPAVDKFVYAEINDLRVSGVGFRDKYIKSVSESVFNKEIILENLFDKNIEIQRESLISLKGVGPKIADCAILFSLRNKKAFPIDTWVKKIMVKLYNSEENNKKIMEIVNRKFGENAGIAQQYLFYYARENKI